MNKWKNLKKSLFQWRGKWCVVDDFLANKSKKFQISNHYTAIFSRPILKSVFDIQSTLPTFRHYDPVELFTDTKLKSSFERSSSDDSFSFNNTDKSQLFEHFHEKDKKEVTLKSMMFNVNKDFNEFLDKYPSIEKVMTYYNDIFENSYKKIFFSISDHFINSYIKANSNTSVFEVCRVKITHHIGGKILINNKEIIFVYHFPEKNKYQRLCDGALFKDGNSKKDQNLIIIININTNLGSIFKRRYYYRKNSLEIFTLDNKSYFFLFLNKDERDNFW